MTRSRTPTAQIKNFPIGGFRNEHTRSAPRNGPGMASLHLLNAALEQGGFLHVSTIELIVAHDQVAVWLRTNFAGNRNEGNLMMMRECDNLEVPGFDCSVGQRLRVEDGVPRSLSFLVSSDSNAFQYCRVHFHY